LCFAGILGSELSWPNQNVSRSVTLSLLQASVTSSRMSRVCCWSSLRSQRCDRRDHIRYEPVC